MQWLKNGHKRPLYIVGGTWRNLAKVHMTRNDYRCKFSTNMKLPVAK